MYNSPANVEKFFGLIESTNLDDMRKVKLFVSRINSMMELCMIINDSRAEGIGPSFGTRLSDWGINCVHHRMVKLFWGWLSIELNRVYAHGTEWDKVLKKAKSVVAKYFILLHTLPPLTELLQEKSYGLHLVNGDKRVRMQLVYDLAKFATDHSHMNIQGLANDLTPETDPFFE
jgi:hypothetical protein